MPPTLYHIPRTISSPLVQCLAELGQLDVIDVQEISFADLKTPHYLTTVNPMGTSPAFMDNGVRMWESGAILDYLLERYDVQHTLHPSCGGCDIAWNTRAKYLNVKQYIIATVYPFVASLFIHTLQNEQDATYVAQARQKWHDVMAPTLENAIDGDNHNGQSPYFLGHTPSALDFLAAKPLHNAHALGLLQPWPKLLALYQHISQRPTFAMAYETNGTRGMNRRTRYADPPPLPKSNYETEDRELVLVPSHASSSEITVDVK